MFGVADARFERVAHDHRVVAPDADEHERHERVEEGDERRLGGDAREEERRRERERDAQHGVGSCPPRPHVRQDAHEHQRERAGGEFQVPQHQRRRFVLAHAASRVEHANADARALGVPIAPRFEHRRVLPRPAPVRAVLLVGAVARGGVPGERQRELEPAAERDRVRRGPARRFGGFGGFASGFASGFGGASGFGASAPLGGDARRIEAVEEPARLVPYAEHVLGERARGHELQQVHQRHGRERRGHPGLRRERLRELIRLRVREAERGERGARLRRRRRRVGRRRRARRQRFEPLPDELFERQQAHWRGAPRRRARLLRAGGDPTRTRERVGVVRRPRRRSAAKVFKVGHRRHGVFHAAYEVQSRLLQHVPSRRPGLIHRSEPVRGVRLPALDVRNRGGRVRWRRRRRRAAQPPRVRLGPLQRREHAVVGDGVRLVPGAERQDPRVDAHVVLRLRCEAFTGKRKGSGGAMRSRDGDAVLGRGGHDERLPKRRGTHNADREERRDE